MPIIMQATILKPPITRAIITITLLIVFPILTLQFTFMAASISLGDSQVGATTTYTVTLFRMYDDLLGQTPWQSTPLAPNATIALNFPPEYTPTMIANTQCMDISINGVPISGFTCSASGLVLTVDGAFAANSLVSDATLTLTTITNPGSALTTSPFIATIGQDISSSSSAAELTFTPGTLNSLTITFATPIVNTTSNMLFTIVPSHLIPASGAITIEFPPSLTWARDLSSSHTIPINGSLPCSGLTSNTNNASIYCQGLFATQTVTVYSAFSQAIAAGQTVTISLGGMFAPPTTEPADSLTVTTRDGALNRIDVSSSFISGLQPASLQQYRMSSSLVTPMGVNNFLGGLTFSFTLPDTLGSDDLFVIVFPSGTNILYMTTASSLPVQTTTYSASNTSMVITQRSNNPNYPAGTAVTITFIRYRAPSSTRPTEPITFTVFKNGYQKMTASATIAAVANNYTLTVASSSTTVNTFAAYSFSFTMADPLTASGYIEVVLDPLLTLTSQQVQSLSTNLSVTITASSMRSTPTFQLEATTINNQSSYLLKLTNLNTSAANIPAQAVLISIGNLLNCPTVRTLTSFRVSTYYSSSGDLVANAQYSSTLKLTPGTIMLNSATSTVSTTYTFGTVNLTLSNQNPVPLNGYIQVTLPAELTLLSVCVGTLFLGSNIISSNVTYDLSNKSLKMRVGTAVPSSSILTVLISNLMTQNSTKPTSTFKAASFTELQEAIDISTNSVSLQVSQGNAFNSLRLSRSDTKNSAFTNYTLVFQPIQSYESITKVSIVVTPNLSLGNLSRVFQQLANGSVVPLIFSILNSGRLNLTLIQSSSTVTIILNTVQNPPSLQPLSSPIQVITLTTDSVYIYSQMHTEDIVNTDPSPDLVVSYAFSNFAYNQSNNLSLELRQPTNQPKAIYKVIVYIPIEFSTASILCSEFTCSLFSPTKTLTITNNSAPFPPALSFRIESLLNPGSSQTAPLTFTIRSYDAQDYLMQEDSTTVVFANNCSSPCRTCASSNSTTCLSCYSTPISNLSLIYQNKCYSECPQGSYLLNDTSCQGCDTSCLSCSKQGSNCSSCNLNGSYPFLYVNSSESGYNGACLGSCPLGTYPQLDACLPCNSTCASCDQSRCFSCLDSFYLYEETCVMSCPNTTLANTTGMLCQPCQSPCKSCQSTASNCTSCPEYTFLSNNTCLSQCPSLNMFVNQAQTCQLCSVECLSCSLESSNCTSCNLSSSASHFYNFSCLSQCPDLYYPQNSTCQPCSSLNINCNNCSSATTCLSCSPNYFLFETNSSCLSETPEGYILINSTFVACNSSCLACEGDVDNCTSCQNNIYLYINSCLQVCPSNVTVAVNGACIACDYPCRQCVNSTTVCLSCHSNSSLFYDSNRSSCVTGEQCPGGTFANANGSLCQRCSLECSLCSDDADNCSACSGGYFWWNNRCLDACVEGTAAVGTICELCQYPCATCQLELTNCSSCASNSSLYLLVNRCVEETECLNTTYPDSSTQNCQPCSAPCLTCYLQPTFCTSCTNNTYLTNSTCVEASQCPLNTLPGTHSTSRLSQCLPCLSGCLSCSVQTWNCSSCNSSVGLFLFNFSCLNGSSCPPTTYPNISSSACQPCLPPCLYCTNISFCLSCMFELVLQRDSTCGASCPSGTFSSNTSGVLKCMNCSSSCRQCSVSESNCSGCFGGSYLLVGQCVNASSCPSGTYPQDYNNTCNDCSSPCQSCENATFCTICQETLYLLPQQGECYPLGSCPPGTFSPNSTSNNTASLQCLYCQSTCKTCQQQSSLCTSCPDSTFLQNLTCVNSSQCLEGTFADNSTSTCQTCPIQCSSCFNQTFCPACRSSYLSYNKFCYSNCPNVTVPKNGSCEPCAFPCQTCINQTNLCTSCMQTNASTYFLQNSSCVLGQNCTVGSYPNISTLACQRCKTECTACDAYYLCTSCFSGYYLQTTGSCVDVCPQGWLGIEESGGGVCRQCQAPCSSCTTTLSNCTGCLQNLTSSLYLDDYYCVLADSCRLGTFPNSTSYTCQQCLSQCASCKNSSSWCLGCNQGYFLLGSACLSNCPNTSVANVSSLLCQGCQANCSTCLGNVERCTSCVLGTYLANNSCTSNCPQGTVAVNASLTCQKCSEGCSACINQVGNCTSCISGNYFYPVNNTCLKSCPTSYFQNQNASTCTSCPSQCLTCTSLATCLSCNIPYLLSNQTCNLICPNATPFNLSNICVSCSVLSACLQCNSGANLPLCIACSDSYILFEGTCLSQCPSGYKNDGKGGCSKKSSLEQALTNSLTIGGVFPLPFTITGSIIFLACFMSKLQNRNTYIVGVAYSLYGFIETASLGYTALTYSLQSQTVDYRAYLLVALMGIGGLNLLGLLFQSYQLSKDSKFQRWLGVRCNAVFYGIVVAVSAVTSYKFKLIVFTKLFSFKCVRAQLEHVQKFRLFNFLSFLGVAHEGLVIYVSALVLLSLSAGSHQFLTFLDLIIVNVLNVVLALAASAKADNFFEEQQDDGIKINKVYNIYDQYEVKGVEDTLGVKKPALESRDHMLDQDDEFTLSISDRNEEGENQLYSKGPIAPPLKNNKSTLLEVQSCKPDQIANASAVYSRDPPKFRKAEQGYSPSPIRQISERHSQQRLSEKQGNQSNQKQRGIEEHSRNIFEGDEDLQLPQTHFIPEQQIPVVIQSTSESPAYELPQQIIEQKPKDAFEQKPVGVAQRELKIYKGSIRDDVPDDIEEIDLTLNKKQRELIELRKSIRKRQRSQERRSQRSRSKDKGHSKGVKSQKGTDIFFGVTKNTGPSRLDPKQRSNSKLLQQQDKDLIKQELIVPVGQFDHALSKRQQAIQKSIVEEVMNQYPATPAKGKVLDIEQNISYVSRSGNPIEETDKSEDHGIGLNLQPQVKAVQRAEQNRLEQNQQQQTERPSKSPKQPSNEEAFSHQKNVFEDLKNSSFIQEMDEENPNAHVQLIGMKPPIRQQKKSISKQDNLFAIAYPPTNLQIDLRADQQHLPLRRQKNRVKGFPDPANQQDAIEDFIEQTQRIQPANRSHLLKDISGKQSRSYQQLEEVDTFRNPSRKEGEEIRKLEKPPLQSRPATSLKSRIYMAGLQQLEGQREDSVSKKNNQDVMNRTTLQQRFHHFKSKDLSGRDEEDNADIYPSSLSSNQLRLNSQQINDEPEKPTIHSRAHRRSNESRERSLYNSISRQSMKSYRSRSIDREEYENMERQKSREQGLRDYYNSKERSKSKSRSRSREGNRSSDKKLKQLEKIYLQKL